jgi:hypothetical protein
VTAVRGLRRTQRWFLGAIERASATPRRRASGPIADVVIAPSPTLAPRERVAIYARSYIARLVEALEADFPVVVALLGHDRFHRVARAYATRRRPRSWTLNDFGTDFPGFLDRTRGLPREALVRDVARIERAMSEAFDAEVTSVLRPADAASVPATRWADTRFAPSPSLRVLALATGANPVVTRVRHGSAPPRRTPPGPAWVAVYRKDDVVYRMDLTRPPHAALSALVRGRTLGEAVSAASRTFEGDVSALPAQVRTWFAQWMGEEWFAGIGPRARVRRAAVSS